MNKYFEKIKEILKIPLVKYILSAITIIVAGFVLFNIAFISAALVYLIVRAPLNLFLSGDVKSSYAWVAILPRVIYLVIVIVISWFILKSKKLPVLAKATYLTLPFIVTFVTIGMLFYQFPAVVIGLSTLITLGSLYYLYVTKRSWHYWFAIIYVAIVALCIIVFNIEI